MQLARTPISSEVASPREEEVLSRHKKFVLQQSTTVVADDAGVLVR